MAWVPAINFLLTKIIAKVGCTHFSRIKAIGIHGEDESRHQSAPLSGFQGRLPSAGCYFFGKPEAFFFGAIFLHSLEAGKGFSGGYP
jgi:hypothetical protein